MNADAETRKVVALRRYNPGLSRGGRHCFEPVFEGDAIDRRWNLVAPPAGRFRIAILSFGDLAGPSPLGPHRDNFEAHPATAREGEVSARAIYSTEGLKARAIALGLVATR